MEVSINTIGIIILLVLVPSISLLLLFYIKLNKMEKILHKSNKSNKSNETNYEVNTIDFNKESKERTEERERTEENFRDENNEYKSKHTSLNWGKNMKILANGSLPLLKISKNNTGQHVKASLSNREYFDVNYD